MTVSGGVLSARPAHLPPLEPKLASSFWVSELSTVHSMHLMLHRVQRLLAQQIPLFVSPQISIRGEERDGAQLLESNLEPTCAALGDRAVTKLGFFS